MLGEWGCCALQPTLILHVVIYWGFVFIWAWLKLCQVCQMSAVILSSTHNFHTFSTLNCMVWLASNFDLFQLHDSSIWSGVEKCASNMLIYDYNFTGCFRSNKICKVMLPWTHLLIEPFYSELWKYLHQKLGLDERYLIKKWIMPVSTFFTISWLILKIEKYQMYFNSCPVSCSICHPDSMSWKCISPSTSSFVQLLLHISVSIVRLHIVIQIHITPY